MGLFKGSDTGDGGKTMLYAGGSQTVLGFAHQAKRRRRVILIAAGVGVVIAGIAGLAITKYMEAEAASRVVDGYSSLTRCLMGEPLTDGESAAVRFRQMQLSSLTQVEVKRSGDKAGPWPDRCAKYAHGLREGLNDSTIGQNKGKGLLDASQALADALDKKDGYWLDMSDAVDKTFDEAKNTGVVLQQRPDVPGPPERAQPLTLDALAKDGVVTDKAVALADVHAQALAEGVVRFVIDDTKNAQQKLCTVAADSARCDELPKAVADAGKGGLRLLASVDDGAQPLLFAGGGAGGIFRATGDKIDALESLGGYSAADGFAAVLAADGAGLKIVLADAKRASSRPMSIGRYKLNDVKRDAELLWNHAVLLAMDGKELAMAAAEVGPRGVGAMDAIGPLPKASLPERGNATDPRIDGCRAGAAVVARARTGRDDFVTFLVNGRWTAPLHTQAAGGALTCHAGEAVITRVETGSGETALDAKVSHQRCTPTECRVQAKPVRELLGGEVGLAPSTPIQAVGLDGKMLMVWQSGQRGGVRLRIGDIDSLASTPDTIVYDEFIQNGKVVEGSSLSDMKLLPAEHFAVLLLATPSGLRALRIAGDGKPTPIKL